MSWDSSIRAMLERRKNGIVAFLLRTALYPLAVVYSFIMKTRYKAYSENWVSRSRAPMPVISVGNISLGGTGKTPFVIMLCRLLKSMQIKPGILIRGYKSKDPYHSDEVTLYRNLLPEVKVYPGKNRVLSAIEAANDGVELLVLDDGFQHLKLMRDMDIVLLDVNSPFGGGRVFPGGMLREPIEALKRSDLFILTRVDQVSNDKLAKIQKELKKYAPNVPVLQSTHRPSRFYDMTGKSHDLQELVGLRVVAISGIGQPEAFAQTLRELGADVREVVAFSDHNEYTAGQFSKALSKVDSSLIPIVTEKDAVKLNQVLSDGYKQDVFVLGIDLRVVGVPYLKEWIEEVLEDAPIV